MTYLERIAAGYEPKWGVYDDSDGTWETLNGDWVKSPIAGTRVVLEGPSDIDSDYNDSIRPRRFWVRKKKQPLGRFANGAYHDHVGSIDESMEAAAQAVVSEVAKRLRFKGLYDEAREVERIAK